MMTVSSGPMPGTTPRMPGPVRSGGWSEMPNGTTSMQRVEARVGVVGRGVDPAERRPVGRARGRAACCWRRGRSRPAAAARSAPRWRRATARRRPARRRPGLLELLEVHRVVDVGDEDLVGALEARGPAMTQPWNTNTSHQSTRSLTSWWRTTSTVNPGSVSSALVRLTRRTSWSAASSWATRQARMAGPAIFGVMLSAVATTTRNRPLNRSRPG